jgi:hypothetical protein
MPGSQAHRWHVVRLACGGDRIEILMPLGNDGRPRAATAPMLFKGTWDGEEGFGEYLAEPDDHLFCWAGDAEPMPTDFGTAPVRVGQVVWVDAGDRYVYRVVELEALDA